MPSFDFGTQIFATLRFADLVDVALVAALLFGLLNWLRQSASPTASRRLVLTLLVFGVIYLLANTFELFLVERFLSVLFLAALVAVVVVFQAEIRRMFTHLSTFNPFASSADLDETTLDQLAEAAVYLAEAKIGALIALKGEEAWDDLIQGGVPLNGLVSQPLLYSLFDPATAGHDGAVLVEGRHVTRFAAHLPLANDLPEESRYGGTRHAAALGLSEHCDALVIVVSEERGVVSVAQGSTLDELASAGDLKEHLREFWERHHARSKRQPRRWIPHPPTASLSLVFACLLWLLFAYSPETISRVVTMPVELRNLPDDWELVNVSPNLVQATLVGSEQAFAQLDGDALSVSFDLSNPRRGVQRLVIREEQLELPSSLRLNSLEPEQVQVDAQPRAAAERP